MTDPVATADTTRPNRIEHRLDALIWRLAKIEGDLADLRRALNAFRTDVVLFRQATTDGGPTDAA